MSLGLTNAIIRRLVTKGFLMIRKVNNRNIQYIVSPEGVDEIARRSYRYFRRTIQNVAKYREAIQIFLERIKADGYDGVALIGKSDVDFIVEYLCRNLDLDYRTESTIKKFSDKTYMLLSEAEDILPEEKKHYIDSLRNVLSGNVV